MHLFASALFVAAALQATSHPTEHGPVVAETLLTGLKQPTAIAFLPDGRALLIERRSARIQTIDLATGDARVVRGGPDALTGDETAQADARRPSALIGEDAGLHDVVLHPRYRENGWIYLSYSSGPRERSTTAVDRYRLRGDELVDRQRIFTADAYSEDRFHYGGRMAFAGPYLFLTVGDRHHEDRAQELTTHAGKLLRLNDDGTAPSDNPFAGRSDARAEIWSYGHRNAQGLAVHPETGELWLNEHGPLGGDELNLVRRGANYGWPVISWGWKYAGGPIGQGITRKEGMEQPVWVWPRAIGPSALLIYSGRLFPHWKHNLFTGAMAAQHLNRLGFREGRVVVEERLLDRAAGRIRMVAEGPDGAIYLGTDGDGLLIRIRPASE